MPLKYVKTDKQDTFNVFDPDNNDFYLGAIVKVNEEYRFYSSRGMGHIYLRRICNKLVLLNKGKQS